MTKPRNRVTLPLTMLCLLPFVGGCQEQPAGGGEPATTSPVGAPDTAGAAGDTTVTPANGGAAVVTDGLPSYWFESDFDKWVGKRWQDVDLLRFMKIKPTGIQSGSRYIVFYNRTCEHCEEMFREDFANNPELARQVSAVEVPADKGRMTSPDAWPMPTTEVEHRQLPLGVNWIITTPLALHLEDGIVKCAEEGDHKGCLGLE